MEEEERKTHPDRHVLFLLLPHTYVLRTHAPTTEEEEKETEAAALPEWLFCGVGG